MPDVSPMTALVLQGGGALGAYQAGAVTALAQAEIHPDWVAGISIGAINAALICGNPPERRHAALKSFWDQASVALPHPVWPLGPFLRQCYEEAAAAKVLITGVPGFFSPRFGTGWLQTNSVYDTSPLEHTLTRLVDFDYLNTHGPRLSVGATDIESGNFVYFDSDREPIRPEHILASGALPPGFPPVEIDGRLYWDGGLVSNTPLQYVFDSMRDRDMTIFQVDLFSARGQPPKNLSDVEARRKDIQFSSRTRLTTDRYLELHRLALRAQTLRRSLPATYRDDPDLIALCNAGPTGSIDLVHLIHRQEDFETEAKDYDFSQLSVTQHWDAGAMDISTTLNHPRWLARATDHKGLRSFDLTRTANP